MNKKQKTKTKQKKPTTTTAKIMATTQPPKSPSRQKQ